MLFDKLFLNFKERVNKIKNLTKTTRNLKTVQCMQSIYNSFINLKGSNTQNSFNMNNTQQVVLKSSLFKYVLANELTASINL